MSRIQPVHVIDGVAALYWTSTLLMQGTGRLVAVSNNADAPWMGALQVRVGDIHDSRASTVTVESARSCLQVECKDLWTGDDVACAVAAQPDQGGYDAVVLNLTIASHAVALIKASCK